MQLEVTSTIEVYIQSRILKKTLETISFEHHREIENGNAKEEVIQRAIGRLYKACSEGGTN